MKLFVSGSGPYGFKYEVKVAGDWAEYRYWYTDEATRDKMFKDSKRNVKGHRNLKKL